MSDEPYTWEFFLAHASADEEVARQLYKRLAPHAKVFLDVESLEAGDDWDQELAKAQRASLIVVVLVSEQTEAAYYQREEIAAALDPALSPDKARRVVPVFLGGKPGEETAIPHGLRLKQSLVLAADGDVDDVAERLLKVMAKEAYRWDFFLAHAPADAKIARKLYRRLAPSSRVFLAAKSLELGKDRDQEIARAQKGSLILVVLVSERTEDSYYQREEIAAAIQLARSKDKEHRVVPVFLDGPPGESSRIPYGLRLKNGLALSREHSIAVVANRLLRLLAKLTGHTPPPRATSRRLKLAIFAAAGLLALVVLGVAIGRSFFGEELPVAPVATSGELVSDMPIAHSCVKVEHLSPRVIPHYLLNSIGSENFPYWLKIIATNQCDSDKFMTVRFGEVHNVVLTPPLEEEFRVPKGKAVSRVLKPKFNLSRPSVGTLEIQWSIEDEDQTKLDADSIRTEILSPYTIDWDLERPKQGGGWEPVDPSYLLASLKAWILKPPRPVANLGTACRTPLGGGSMLVKEPAIAACYESLFSGAEAIPVLSETIRFPASERRQPIQPHAEIVAKGRTVSSLEAALLFAAVLEADHQHGVDPDLTLLVAPVEGAANPDREKTVFLAWREGGRWRGVDMSRVSTEGFAANAARSSARIATLLELSSEVRTAIAERGAGFSSDGRIAAVDFGAIPREYRIRRLSIVAAE